jgi:hypothetical protein
VIVVQDYPLVAVTVMVMAGDNRDVPSSNSSSQQS